MYYVFIRLVGQVRLGHVVDGVAKVERGDPARQALVVLEAGAGGPAIRVIFIQALRQSFEKRPV